VTVNKTSATVRGVSSVYTQHRDCLYNQLELRRDETRRLANG